MKRVICVLVICFSLFGCYSLVTAQVQIGQTITGEASGDVLGRAVAFSYDGSRVVIGSPLAGNGSIL